MVAKMLLRREEGRRGGQIGWSWIMLRVNGSNLSYIQRHPFPPKYVIHACLMYITQALPQPSINPAVQIIMQAHIHNTYNMYNATKKVSNRNSLIFIIPFTAAVAIMTARPILMTRTTGTTYLANLGLLWMKTRRQAMSIFVGI